MKHRLTFTEVRENEEYLLTVTLERACLEDEGTAYPITVDPSFSVLSDNNGIIDTSVRANGTAYSDSLNNGVGHHNTLLEDMRSFIKFPGLLENETFGTIAPPGWGGNGTPELVSVKLQMCSRGTNTAADTDIYVYAYDTSSSLDWTNSTKKFTAAQFNALGRLVSTTKVPWGSFNKWIDFDITNAVTSSSASKGIVLVNEFEGEGNEPVYASFASADESTNRPRIVVTWQSEANTSFAGAMDIDTSLKYDISIDSTSKSLYYSFTPSANGFYTFESSEGGSSLPTLKLYSSNERVLETSKGSSSRDAAITYHLSKGEKYYLETSVGSVGSFVLSVKDSDDLTGISSTTGLTKDKTISVGSSPYCGRRYYVFTADDTCSYTFESNDNGKCDPCAWLYSSDGRLISSGDNEASNNNYRIKAVLKKGESYYIAVGHVGEASGSSSIVVTVTTPDAASEPRASSVTGDTVKLTWSVPKGYSVDRWLIQLRVAGSADWINAATATTRPATVSGLSASTSYEFRVISEIGSTAWQGKHAAPSETLTVKTLPAQPTGLKLGGLTGERVTFTWSTASPHGADRWRIEYKSGSSSWQTAGYRTYKGFELGGLDASTAYDFRVFSERDEGSGVVDSLVSETLNVMTLPAQPTGLTVSDITSGSVKLTWSTASPHGADRWVVEYRTAGGTWTRHGSSTYKGYFVTGLAVGTTYEFRVYAERSASSSYAAANSLVSNTVTATTKVNNTVQKMLDNIRNGTAVSASKKEACLLAAEALLNKGYEPAFVAGLLGNIVAEGDIGLFEWYNTGQDYHLNLNGYLQEYYNTTYNEMFHGKYIYEMDLNKVYEIVTNLKNMNWRVSQEQANRWSGGIGNRIFTGVGCVGWSESRLYTMIELYREVCNNRSTIAEEEVKKAEALMMVRELSGRYAGVYNNWKSVNASSLDSQAAAIDAAAKICDNYEKPDFDETQKPNTREVRLELAPKIYLEMIK